MTGESTVPDAMWSAATFDGARAHQRQAVATATPTERMAWLLGALRLAEQSGALAAARAVRQRECDRMWGVGQGS